MYYRIVYPIFLLFGLNPFQLPIGNAQELLPDSAKRVQLEGVFINMNSLQPEKHVQVIIREKDSNRVDTLTTNEEGNFFYELNPAGVYMISGTKPQFFDSKPITISTRSHDSDEAFQLQIPIKRMEMNVLYRLNVDFPINGHKLYAEMVGDLEYVLKFVLQRNPNLVIEIGVHTDSRGNDRYNLELSQKRADAIVDYFLYNGIDKKQIVGKGYGESRIINKCVNGIKCSSELHSQNRRVEFRILQF